MKKYIPIALIISLAFFLRIYQIASSPPGLYSDETSYGYNAYSLLKTGKDEYGKSWPMTFKSFGDFKPPMTAWLTIPSIAVFGLNEFSVRLPSVLAGTITVLIVYFLANEILPNKKLSIINYQLSIGDIAALLLAISPWHLHFSRTSMLVAIEAMFVSLGLLLFLKSLKKSIWLYFSALSFAAAIYTYYGSRVTVILLTFLQIIIFHKKLWQMRKHVIGAMIVGIIALLPLAISFIQTPETLTGRARTISVFYDPGVRAKLWYSRSIDNSRFFHNKPYYYFRDIARRYLQHFSFNFFVRTGDTTPPFDIPNMGIVYIADIIFVFYGVFLAVCNRTNKSIALLGYLFISPVVASFTFITPAANRAFNMVIPWTIFTSLGIVTVLSHWKKFPFRLLLTVCYLLLFSYYLYQYYVRMPLDMPHKWHYGRRELVEKISQLEGKYNQIVFSNREGPAYIWLLFYQQYNPDKYRDTMKVDEQFDELGWLHIKSFDKYVFPRHFEWNAIDKTSHTLYVGYENQIPQSESVVIDKILYPNGETAFTLAEYAPTH